MVTDTNRFTFAVKVRDRLSIPVHLKRSPRLWYLLHLYPDFTSIRHVRLSCSNEFTSARCVYKPSVELQKSLEIPSLGRLVIRARNSLADSIFNGAADDMSTLFNNCLWGSHHVDSAWIFIKDTLHLIRPTNHRSKPKRSYTAILSMNERRSRQTFLTVMHGVLPAMTSIYEVQRSSTL